jgi:hypothetical protein
VRDSGLEFVLTSICNYDLQLQQTLEFGKIDRFHGTGAFNMTLFPSWDSLFLNLVVLPKEVVVVTVQGQKRSHRGLSGGNTYLENLGKKDAQVEKERTNPYLEEVSEYERQTFLMRLEISSH